MLPILWWKMRIQLVLLTGVTNHNNQHKKAPAEKQTDLELNRAIQLWNQLGITPVVLAIGITLCSGMTCQPGWALINYLPRQEPAIPELLNHKLSW